MILQGSGNTFRINKSFIYFARAIITGFSFPYRSGINEGAVKTPHLLTVFYLLLFLLFILLSLHLFYRFPVEGGQAQGQSGQDPGDRQERPGLPKVIQITAAEKTGDNTHSRPEGKTGIPGKPGEFRSFLSNQAFSPVPQVHPGVPCFPGLRSPSYRVNRGG